MKVIYFSKCSSRGPSSRYRIYQFVPYLEAAGIDCSVRPLFAEGYFSLLDVRSTLLRVLGKVIYVGLRFLKRLWDLIAMGQPDLVVIEGQLFPYCPAWMEWGMKRIGYKIVVEIDDAIYLTPGHRRKIPALLAMASGAIVGNETLARYARQCTAQVAVIPTVVDTRRFAPGPDKDRLSEKARHEPVTVVWIGLAYNLGYLDLVAPAMRTLQEEGLIKFRVVCSKPPQLPGLRIEFRPWRFDREVEDLQGCHIGIMPLPATKWAEGKCGLKLLQYMSLEMATVASPVGVNRDIVLDGETGLLAATEQEWRDKLVRLCNDVAFRERMGRAARRTVEERYSLHVWGPRLAEHYRRLIVDDETLVRDRNLMAGSLKGCP